MDQTAARAITNLMAKGTQIHGFDVIETLGHGARSTIYAVRAKDGQVFALKHVIKREDADQRFLDQAQTEHDVAHQLDHPILRKSLRLIRGRRLIRTNEIVVLMEMVDGHTLEQANLSDTTQISRLCQQVALGLGAMHEAGFIHADIKPNNILVTDDGHAKIIDFGQSCSAGTVKERIQGTPDYIAPEQVLRREMTAQTDVFNLGATMYWLLTNKHVPTLFPKGEPGLSFKTDDACAPPRDLNPQVPPALSSLVMKCIQTDPTDRPESMARIHDWLDIAISQIRRGA